MNCAHKILALALATTLPLIAGQGAAAGQPKKEARVTQVIRDVKLLTGEARPKPASLNDQVREDTAVRTGDRSRSELAFADLRITRLGANTIFSFNQAGRNLQLNQGSMLLYTPKNSGGAQMSTLAVSVAITGTTVTLEARVPRGTRPTTETTRTIFVQLEGRPTLVSLIKYPRESVYVQAGQMLDVPAGASKMPQPVDVDLSETLKSPLVADFPPLPSENLILTRLKDPPIYQGRVVGPGGIPAPSQSVSIFPTKRPRDLASPSHPAAPNKSPDRAENPTKPGQVRPPEPGRSDIGKPVRGGSGPTAVPHPSPTPRKKRAKNSSA